MKVDEADPNCGNGTYSENMAQPKTWIPVLFKCIDTNLTIRGNIGMENPSQEVTYYKNV